MLLALLWACTSNQEPGPPTIVGGSPTQNAPTLPPVTPPPRPASVPEAAGPIVQTATLGRIERRANQPPTGIETRELIDGSCVDDVMTLETSQEMIYAGLPCDRFWPPEAEAAFAGQQIAIVLEVSATRFRVLIETLPGGQSEFTVQGIWVE